MKMRIRAFLAVSIIGCLFLFQNCSSPQAPVEFKQVRLASADSGENNGIGYDGKVYVLLGAPCPDSSLIHDRIILKSISSGHLVRSKCVDIPPVAIGSNEFSIDSVNPNLLNFQNQTFNTQIPFGALALDTKAVRLSDHGGFSFILEKSFGTPGDNLSSLTSRTQSKLVLYEDGMALGPAHSEHLDVASLGQGRYSHWFDSPNLEALYFSASDNSNPTTNGRTYSYRIE